MPNIVFSPKYEVDIGAHVFPTTKYRLVKEKLIKEKIAVEADFIAPQPAEDKDILLVHTKEYLEKLKNGKLSVQELYTLELPYSKELVEVSLLCAGGSILSGEIALKEGVGIHLGGGFHHAYPDHGEGFCVLNDHSIAIRKLQKEKKIKKALIVDCDLHQGNGTAAIFSNDKHVFTFSIHQENNYPFIKPPSSLDIGLEDGTKDREYLEQLEINIPKITKEFRPELICYVAGGDPYEHDQLGGLAISMAGLKKRDEIVINEAKNNKIPLMIVFAGGYAHKLADTVQIHFNTIKEAVSKK